jgi:hypothetical protein
MSFNAPRFPAFIREFFPELPSEEDQKAPSLTHPARFFARFSQFKSAQKFVYLSG